MFNLRFLVMLLLISSNLFGLSKEAEVDLIKSQLVESQKKGYSNDIIKLVKRWRELDKNIPISISFWEAKAYYKVQKNRKYDENQIKSFKLLEHYINTAGRSGRFYKEALQLYILNMKVPIKEQKIT